MLAVDGDGNVVDGDQIVAILAVHLQVPSVTVTPMTNGGFHKLMSEHGIQTYVTGEVGDRYVLEALREVGGKLGGEQSGHIIYLEGHVTGDGLAAALLLCRALEGRTLAEAAAMMPRYPQAKENVRVRDKTMSSALLEQIAMENAAIHGRGRVLVRPSGTEPVVRVLAEGRDEAEAARLCASIAALVRRELG
jgi:phosphoglucosamine mutase